MKTIISTPFFTKFVVLVSLALLGFTSLQAQNAQKLAKVKGTVTDAQTNAPLSYATIRILKSTDSTLISGAITDDKGQLTVDVPYGQFLSLIHI